MDSISRSAYSHRYSYTKPQTEILSEHLRYIDFAIEYCEQTKDYTNDAKFRWTCESAWAVDEYLKNRPEEQVNKLKKYIAEGQIEVASMYFNMSEIVDENSLKTFLQPVKEFRKHGIPSTLAMQNDSTELHGVWQIICRTSG
mgnify:CR=1 FL=1